MFRGNKSSKIGPSEMAGKTFVLEGATMVAKMKTEPPLGGGSTFLTKREC
jgi:hypothetical protein